MSKARDLANAGTALTTVSATELGYLDGVTSAVQTQIDSKIGSASAINPTIVDAKGDIVAATAADTVSRLAVGANDTVLTADSSAATGLKWATPAAGGGFTLLSTTTWSNGSAGSITVSSISQDYKHLFISATGFSVTGSPTEVSINPNGSGSCSVVGVYTNSGGTSTLFNGAFSSFTLYPNAINTSDTGQGFGGWIYNYTTTVHKPMMFAGAFNSGGGTGRGCNFAGVTRITSAVTSLVFNVAGATSISSGTILIYGVN